MTLSFTTLKKYAETRNTRVIPGAYKIADDYKSVTFVLESGQKLTMTETELNAAIEKRARVVELEQAEDVPALTAKQKKELAKQEALAAEKLVKDKLGTTGETS